MQTTLEESKRPHSAREDKQAGQARAAVDASRCTQSSRLMTKHGEDEGEHPEKRSSPAREGSPTKVRGNVKLTQKRRRVPAIYKGKGVLMGKRRNGKTVHSERKDMIAKYIRYQ